MTTGRARASAAWSSIRCRRILGRRQPLVQSPQEKGGRRREQKEALFFLPFSPSPVGFRDKRPSRDRVLIAPEGHPLNSRLASSLGRRIGPLRRPRLRPVRQRSATGRGSRVPGTRRAKVRSRIAPERQPSCARSLVSSSSASASLSRQSDSQHCSGRHYGPLHSQDLCRPVDRGLGTDRSPGVGADYDRHALRVRAGTRKGRWSRARPSHW